MIEDLDRRAALSAMAILDTPAEPAFDRIVQIAGLACDTPVALISFVGEDRQWFKARVGFDPCQTPLDQSVCAHAVAENLDLLVIPDLTLDARTKANRLVTHAPHIRFYAGALLRTSGGAALGTLCVIAPEPRPQGLTATQAAMLRALADLVMHMLETRQLLTGRDDALVAAVLSGGGPEAGFSREEAERLRKAQAAGRIGIFDVAIATDVAFVSAELCRIVGLPERPVYPAASIEALIHPEDRNRPSSSASRQEGTAPADTEYRILRASDGAERWIARRAEFVLDAQGRPERFVGTLQDVTDRKLKALRAAALVRLGDDLREAGATADVARSAGRILGETLNVARAGYAVVDRAAGLLWVEADWSAPGTQSLVGRHALDAFRVTVERIAEGRPLVVPNIPFADWLGADRATYEAIGARSQIVVPLAPNGTLVGLVYAHGTAPRTWDEEEAGFAYAVADRAYAAMAKVQAEQEQSLLNQELSHRLKNTLSMVQAIASQTLRGVGDRAAVEAFSHRLHALSTAHDILLQGSWAAARIRFVVDESLGRHGEAARFAIQGPNIMIGPKAVLSLSMLLHELGTNAVKYGALSVPGGRVAVAWRVEGEGAGTDFVLTWTEAGGPAAQAPARRGFGSRLIAMGLMGTGRAEPHYGPDGFSAVFRALLPLMTAG